MDNCMTDISKLNHTVNKQHDYINKLVTRIDVLDQHNRNCNLRIYDRKDSTNDNTPKALYDNIINKVPLKIETPIEIYRIGKLMKEKSMSIFMRFNYEKDRYLIFKNKRL